MIYYNILKMYFRKHFDFREYWFYYYYFYILLIVYGYGSKFESIRYIYIYIYSTFLEKNAAIYK